jgi:hypothetical protein
MVAQVLFATSREAAPPARESVDEFQQQWERVHRRFAARPQPRPFSVAELCRAYEEATGTWVGSD